MYDLLRGCSVTEMRHRMQPGWGEEVGRVRGPELGPRTLGGKQRWERHGRHRQKHRLRALGGPCGSCNSSWWGWRGWGALRGLMWGIGACVSGDDQMTCQLFKGSAGEWWAHTFIYVSGGTRGGLVWGEISEAKRQSEDDWTNPRQRKEWKLLRVHNRERQGWVRINKGIQPNLAFGWQWGWKVWRRQRMRFECSQ